MSTKKLDLTKIDWYAVLPRLGIEPDLIANPKKLGRCPIENEGKTRFRFQNKDGRGNWFCNACGGGDGVRLVALMHGVSDTKAIFMIHDLDNGLGVKGPPLRVAPLPVVKKDPVWQRKMLQRVWSESIGVANSPVADYILRRIPGFRLEWLSNFLAFHPNLYHVDEERKKAKGVFPAMVGKVAGLDGKPVTLHRTYLSKDGYKAPVSPSQVKKLMTGSSDLAGESIRLNTSRIKSRVAIVCEGIETGLALVAATGNRHSVFSALNAGNLAKFQLSRTEFDTCIVCADKDAVNPKHGWRPGEHYAQKLSDRLVAEGFNVKFRVPEVEGQDFADLWEKAYMLKLAA